MKKILFFILVLLYTGCGVNVDQSDENATDTNVTVSNTSEAVQPQSELEYLNFLRNKAGMISLASDDALKSAAENHAYYLYVNNTTGHYEDENNPGYTGYAPVDRALYAGYLSRFVLENVSNGQEDYKGSIDGLFSAIYHRFGFLSEDIDTIGIGIEDKNYVYDMGNSILNTLCGGDSFESAGSYYYDVCKDEDFKIEASEYLGAFDDIRKQNADVILWPYKDANDIPPAFYNEDPDPLPDYSVSGYPVSVKFNRYYFDSNITLKTFKIFDENGNEITNTRLLDKNTDPNGRFDEYEYALYPLDRLEWNTTYSAEVSYEYNSQDYTISWSFKTRDLGYPVYRITTSDETVYVDSNKTNAFYFVPANGDDVITGYSYSYPGGVSVSAKMADNNTLLINVLGESGDEINFEMNNGDKLKLIIK